MVFDQLIRPRTVGASGRADGAASVQRREVELAEPPVVDEVVVPAAGRMESAAWADGAREQNRG
jgi:hypothetical protein